MKKPYIGAVVVFFQGHPEGHNGHREHPAVVTQVWSDTCVNLKVLSDCGPVYDVTSVPFGCGSGTWDYPQDEDDTETHA